MYIKTYELYSNSCLLIPLRDEIKDILIPLIDNKIKISFYDRNKIKIRPEFQFEDFNFNKIKDELYFLEAFLNENGIIFDCIKVKIFPHKTPGYKIFFKLDQIENSKKINPSKIREIVLEFKQKF